MNEKHELTTGAGLRAIHRRFADIPEDIFSYVEPWGRYSHEPTGTDVILNAYAQLETQITDKLTSTLGAKVEYFSLNDSVEFQPQARLLYKHSQEQQFWAGIGRAVVTPSFVDTKTDGYFLGTVEITDGNGNVVATAPGVVFTQANEDLKTESVVTLDIGHRFSPMPSLNIDSTLFFSQYNNSRMEGESAWECTFGNCPDGSTIPNYVFTMVEKYSDGLDVENYGFETAIRWTPFESLTLNTSYSYIQTEATCSNHFSCDIDLTTGIKTKYNNQPSHFVSVQSLWDFAPGWQLDLWYKYKSAVDTPSPYYKEPSVSTVDLRLAWQHQPHWPRVELVVDGFGEHAYSELQGKAPIEETIYFKASWNIQ